MSLNNSEIVTINHSMITQTTTTPQTYLEINAAAFNHNAAYYKNKIGIQNALAAVIKGNGYGHGLEQIATLCEQSKHIDWVCVAQLSEALKIQNILSKPLLVLGYYDANPEYAVHKNIHFMVDHLEYAENLNEIGKKYTYQFNIHVKIDTGLSRMGVLVHEAIAFMQQLQNLEFVHIAGIYSHFSASDSNPEFTQYQFEQYNQLIEQLYAHKIVPTYMHMSNSASISTIEYPAHFNFFRVGLGLYGLGLDKDQLQPVMSWKTHIVHIKTIPNNSYVSYTGSYKTTRPTKIALLPIGYYDGYDFRFSNKTSVVINGSCAPILGRIAMNITIIDVTHIDAHINDEVILIGYQNPINVHTLAELGNIKNVREVITGINPLIPRMIIWK